MSNIQPTGMGRRIDPRGLTKPTESLVPTGAPRAAVGQDNGNGYGGDDHYGVGFSHGYQSHQQGDFARIWHFLLEKAWVMVLTTIVALGLGYVYGKRAPVLYAATATVQAEQDQPKILNLQMMEVRDPQAVEYLQTVAQSLNNRALLERVADTNHLWNDPRFTNRLVLASPFGPDASLGSAFPTNHNESVVQARVLDALERIVKVRLRRGTRLIDITVTHRWPDLAALIANSIVNEYVNENAEREETSIGLATRSLSKQAERVRKKLEESEKVLQAYIETNKAVSLDERQNTVVAALKELSTKATEARSLRLKTEAEYAQITSLGTNNGAGLLVVPTVAKDPTVMALQLELEKAENDFAAVSQRYKVKHPKYIQSLGQVEGLKASLTNAVLSAAQTVKASLENARAAEEALNKALADQEASALELNKLSIQYKVLAREVESDRTLYDELLKGTQEASVSKETHQTGIVRVVQKAYVPYERVSPKRLAILALSGLGGILFGALVLVGFRVTDTSIKTVDDAETLLDMSVFSVVPQMRKVNNRADHALLITADPKSAGAEAFRTLRASLATQGDLHERRVFLITSALPGEGKTFCSLNYAASLAQLGLKTLLIDADLRKPSVEMSLLGVESRSPGLTDYLSGKKRLEQIVRPAKLENLYFISEGSIATSPAELLTQEGLEGLIKEALQHYDRVVVDSAPINAVSDTLLILKSVQTVCLVVRAAHTSSRYVLRAVQLLQNARAPLSGVILNRMPRRHGPTYGAYYDYRHHGKYGKDYVYGAAKTD